MTMRFFEFKLTEDEIAALQTQGPRVAAPAGQPDPAAVKAAHPADEQPAAAPKKKGRQSVNDFYFDVDGNRLQPDQAANAAFVFASNNELEIQKSAIDEVLKPQFPNIKVKRITDTTPSHIRILYVPFDEIEDTINQTISTELIDPQGQGLASIMSNLTRDKTFVKKYAEINGKFYPFIFNQATGEESEDGEAGPILIANKQLTPDNLFGSGGVFNSADDLATQTKSKLAGFVRDQKLLQALNQLVDVANGKLNAVQPDLMAYITKSQKSFSNISKDFGEVLTPIKIAKETGDSIAFPSSSNSSLADVKVGGMDVAVKSLSGSGNGMDSIMDLIIEYENVIKGSTDEKIKKLYSILRGQQTQRGKITSSDNLVKTSFMIPTAEATKLKEILGVNDLGSFKELETAVGNWVKQFDQYSKLEDKYKAYLEAIKPISIAAGRSKQLKNGTTKLEPVGMPGDAGKYISYDDVEGSKYGYRESGAWLPEFKKNFARAASLQLTYLLGISSERLLNKDGADGEAMTDLLTSIMRSKGAQAAHIEINKDGTLTMIKKPFSGLKFGYQYHAATNAPNRNAPGWHIIFD